MISSLEKRRKKQLEAAEGFLSLGMPDHALEALKQVSDFGSAEFYSLLLRGDAWRAKHNYEQALECFLKAHELKPQSLDALMGMAWCYKRTDRVAQSVECMRTAYQDHATESIVLYNMACYLALDGNREQALSWLGRALRMDKTLCKLIPAETDFDSLKHDPDFQHLLELMAGE
jgi:tetratricopeptide (TPR) repeat protein